MFRGLLMKMSLYVSRDITERQSHSRR